MSLHRLYVAFDAGDPWVLYGPEDTMQTQYDELRAAMEAPDGTTARVLELHGLTDTYDRAPVSFVVRPDSVRSVQLSRMAYG